MMEQLTIGTVARLTGLTTKTIRFYEEGGYIPPAERMASGYRTYTSADVRRLQIVKLARLLGLSLSEIKVLVEQAFAVDCAAFATEFMEIIDRQQSEIARRIEELHTLSRELTTLKSHVEHCQCEPGATLSDCDYCSVIGDAPPISRALSLDGGQSSGRENALI